MTRLKRLLPALLLAALACLAAASPALALDLNPANYFQLTYDPITFDKTVVAPGGAFHTTIKGQATCYKNIPIPVSRAEITSRVVARSAGASYTLNSGFTIEINPFPTKQGDAYDINVPLTMQFPPEAHPGDYQVVWQLVQARARITLVWTDVTGSLPAEQAMGTITIAAVPSTTTTKASPAAGGAGTTTATPALTTTTPAVTSAPTTTTITTSRPLPQSAPPLWLRPLLLPLGIGVAVIAAIIVIIIVVRRRYS